MAIMMIRAVFFDRHKDSPIRKRLKLKSNPVRPVQLSFDFQLITTNLCLQIEEASSTDLGEEEEKMKNYVNPVEFLFAKEIRSDLWVDPENETMETEVNYGYL